MNVDDFLKGRKDFADHVASNFWNGDHIKITKENWKQLLEQLEINEE